MSAEAIMDVEEISAAEVMPAETMALKQCLLKE